ncbi:calcium-binding protein [Amaricoccus macauensis]|uniref:calcium-binding protein n=1 Tax=Amaricoccus macauensis TaxID=57001 RepID=UPI003C7DE628
MTSIADAIVGTDQPDVLVGDGETKVLKGLGGDDWIFGDAGNNRLEGNAGDDSMSGGEGDDLLVGGLGSNELAGGYGADRFAIRSDATQHIVDFDPYEGDSLVIWDSAFLNDDGTADLDTLMVQDFGYDLILLGKVGDETQVLARMEDAAGLSLYEILHQRHLDEIPADTSTEETLAPGETIAGEFEYGYDEDWYAFETEADTYYAFTVETDPDAETPADYPDAGLYDADGYWIEDSIYEYTETGVIAYFYAEDAATIYVSAYESFYEASSYLISAEEIAFEDTVPGDPSTTETIAVGETVIGGIMPPYDSDWYAAELTEGETYVFNLDPDPSAEKPLEDTYLTLFDSEGFYITENDDADFDDYSSEIVYTAEETGTVYVSAEGFDSSTGDFILSLDTLILA